MSVGSVWGYLGKGKVGMDNYASNYSVGSLEAALRLVGVAVVVIFCRSLQRLAT